VYIAVYVLYLYRIVSSMHSACTTSLHSHILPRSPYARVNTFSMRMLHSHLSDVPIRAGHNTAPIRAFARARVRSTIRAVIPLRSFRGVVQVLPSGALGECKVSAAAGAGIVRRCWRRRRGRRGRRSCWCHGLRMRPPRFRHHDSCHYGHQQYDADEHLHPPRPP
jgi:hypothetical protein